MSTWSGGGDRVGAGRCRDRAVRGGWVRAGGDPDERRRRVDDRLHEARSGRDGHVEVLLLLEDDRPPALDSDLRNRQVEVACGDADRVDERPERIAPAAFVRSGDRQGGGSGRDLVVRDDLRGQWPVGHRVCVLVVLGRREALEVRRVHDRVGKDFRVRSSDRERALVGEARRCSSPSATSSARSGCRRSSSRCCSRRERPRPATRR